MCERRKKKGNEIIMLLLVHYYIFFYLNNPGQELELKPLNITRNTYILFTFL